jgi:hypothetical protein
MNNFAADMEIKTAHGLTLTEWNALTDVQRAELRDTVTDAPYFERNAA